MLLSLLTVRQSTMPFFHLVLPLPRLLVFCAYARCLLACLRTEVHVV